MHRRHALATWWLPSLLYLAITGVAVVPGDDLPTTSAPDWLGHAAEFAALGWTLRRPVRRVDHLVALLVLGGGVNEALQFLAPGRSPSWRDLVADVIGGAIGWGVARWVRER